MSAKSQKVFFFWLFVLASAFVPIQPEAAELRIHSYNALPRPREPITSGPIPSGLNPQSRPPAADLGGVPYRPLSSQSGPQGYTPSPNDFRIVDGQLYNVMLSTNWRAMEQWLGVYSLKFEIADKGHDSALGDWFLLNVHKQNLGTTMESHLLKQVIVRNMAPPDKLAIGENWASQHNRFMHVGTVQTEEHKTLDVYDAGLPNTPENRALVRSTSTTAPPKPSSQATKKTVEAP